MGREIRRRMRKETGVVKKIINIIMGTVRTDLAVGVVVDFVLDWNARLVGGNRE